MAYTESAKINKKQMVTLVKEGIMPKAVFDWVETWRKTAHSRWITITVSASQSVYFAEDREYTMFYKGLQAQHQCGGEWTGYKSKDLVNTRMQVPEGTWYIESGYFMGKAMCHIVNVGPIVISS